MFKVLRKIENNLIDARLIGIGFLARHFRPWASHHVFTYAGKPVTIRSHTTDARTVRYLLNEGEYELPLTARRQLEERYQAIVDAGNTPVIVDAGGNIGMTAIWFSHGCPKAKVVTIEPDPGDYEILSKNVAPWPQITSIRAAIGGEAGTANMSGQEEWAYQATRAEGGDTPIITIDEAKMRAGPTARLFIVKIDIEGFEAEVFDGNCAWLDETECLMIEPHDWLRPEDRTSRSFQREMGKRDFNLYIRGNNLLYVRR